MPIEEEAALRSDDRQQPHVLSAVEEFAALRWEPKPYQERGINWLLQLTDPQKGAAAGAALFLPPGLGKTSIGLAAILKLKELGLPHRTLVLAPLMVCRTTWMTEPQKWLQFQGLKVGLAHGPDRALILQDTYYDIVVMNYDGIEWAVPLLERGHKFTILLCDELPRLKNTASKRYKRLKHSLYTFAFRWGFTGTPVSNGLVDLFGQVFVLDVGARLGPYITKFRLEYFYQKPFDQYRFYSTPTQVEKLTAKIKDLAMYVKPEEWLDLPPFLTVIRTCVLPAPVMKKYKFLEDEFMLALENVVLTVANAGILTMKLRQFTGGGIYTSSGVWESVDDTKLDDLDSLLEELAGEPLLVAYQFEHELERILKRHPKALFLKGGMSEKLVTSTVEKWNLGEVPLMLVQPQAAAHGINLQFGGAAVAWFTMTYNLEDYLQLNARLYRSGQTKTVRCYLLAAASTIDLWVAKVLANKDAVQIDLLTSLKFERNEL
jgi:SNF2 family DNA or RNA helicase